MRFEDINVCKECREYGINCEDSTKCKPIKTKPHPFSGIRHTADGFDCALPVTIDSHSSCAFECLYCFSDNILNHTNKQTNIGQTSLKTIENIFKDKKNENPSHWHTKNALKYTNRNKDGFPCAVQLGGLCDAGDSIEQNQGWLLKFMDLAIKYDQPVRMSTKGGVFLLPEYLKKIAKKPHLFWIAFSTITDNDEIIKKIDRFAPNATQRILSVKNLTKLGVKTSLRLRPIMLGITDKNKAYESLINKFADAGSIAISYEVGFYPQAIPNINKWKWNLLSQISGYDLKKIYKSFGSSQACTRPSYLWTENIMHKIAEISKERGLTIGVSDPVWKQLSEVGCCCGIKPDDPIFGNWEKENATNALLEAKKTGENIYLKDITPEWAKTLLSSTMILMGAGPLIKHKLLNETWADVLRSNWNDINKQRSVMNYFQGALIPNGIDTDGNRIYKYKGLERANFKTQWNV